MIQLVYVSRSEIPVGGSMPALRTILSASQARNGSNDVTGYLIADGRSFFQILEGHPGDVRETFARIEADRRHSQIKLLATRSVFSRSFPEWSMGGWMATRDTLGIFLRHGLDARYSHAEVTASQVLSLARELRDLHVGLNPQMRVAS